MLTTYSVYWYIQNIIKRTYHQGNHSNFLKLIHNLYKLIHINLHQISIFKLQQQVLFKGETNTSLLRFGENPKFSFAFSVISFS